MDIDKRLTIGKASDLHKRVITGLILGKRKHSSEKKIRTIEDLSILVVRWARTDRPAAVEEELHRRHQ